MPLMCVERRLLDAGCAWWAMKYFHSIQECWMLNVWGETDIFTPKALSSRISRSTHKWSPFSVWFTYKLPLGSPKFQKKLMLVDPSANSPLLECRGVLTLQDQLRICIQQREWARRQTQKAKGLKWYFLHRVEYTWLDIIIILGEDKSRCKKRETTLDQNCWRFTDYDKGKDSSNNE